MSKASDTQVAFGGARFPIPDSLLPNSDLGHHVLKRVEAFTACVQVLEGAQPEEDREEGQSVAGWVLGTKRKREANVEEALCLAGPHHSAHLLPNLLVSQTRASPCWLTPAVVQGPCQLSARPGPRLGVALSSICANDTLPRARQRAELASYFRKLSYALVLAE